MANEIRDMFEGIKTFFDEKFPTAEVKLAFKDERADSDRSYPAVTISMYDVTIGNQRRFSGVDRIRTDNVEGTETQLTKVPIPIDMFFQLDTFSTKRDDDWVLQHKAFQVFGVRNSKIVTPAGREFWIIPSTFMNMDKVEDQAIWRKVYRFKANIWFDHPDDAEQAYLILQQHIVSLGESVQPVEVS